MLRITGLLLIGLGLHVFTISSHAKSKDSFRISAEVGMVMHDMDGITGANFTQMQHYSLGVGIFYKYGRWENGLQALQMPGIAIKEFVLTSAEVGNYSYSVQSL